MALERPRNCNRVGWHAQRMDAMSVENHSLAGLSRPLDRKVKLPTQSFHALQIHADSCKVA